MDYVAIIHAFVDDFVENKEAILIRELKNDNPELFKELKEKISVLSLSLIHI